MAIDPFSQRPLGLLDRLYLVQGAPLDQVPVYQPQLAAPLKILVMVASPEDSSYKRRLSFEEEERQILLALDAIQTQQSIDVQIDFTEDGSLEALKRKLEQDPYHILHLTCHGSFREGKGYLELEDPVNMRSELVEATQFAEALVTRSDGYKIPLVVLSACQTAQGSPGSDTRGISQEVLKKGIPAVVAMSLSVQDHYASRFAANLYQGIARLRSLPQAFQQALQELNQKESQQNSHALQWTIPRLYAQQKVAHLIDSSQALQPLSRKLSQYFSDDLLKEKLTQGQTKKDTAYLFIGRREEQTEALAPTL